MVSVVRRHRATAFTLVELLVVIGIIAVLIGILMPVLSKARAQANRAVCLSNIRQLGNAILMYCNDNDGWFPTCAYWEDGVAYRQLSDDWLHWQANRKLDESAIARYVGRGEQLKSLLRCPADNFDNRRTRSGIAPGQGPYLYTYGMNAALAANVNSGWGARTKITIWRATSRKVLITETKEKYCTAAAWNRGTPLAWRHGTVRFPGNVPGNPDLARGATTGINVSAVFLDGHAEGIDDAFALNEMHDRPDAQ